MSPVPSKPLQNVFAKDKENATEITVLWEPPPEQFIHGILRGYLIWYSIIQLGIHEKRPVFPRDYESKQLPADANKDTLTDLESYAKYNIKIVAFTSKGYGPIKEIITSTSLTHFYMFSSVDLYSLILDLVLFIFEPFSTEYRKTKTKAE